MDIIAVHTSCHHLCTHVYAPIGPFGRTFDCPRVRIMWSECVGISARRREEGEDMRKSDVKTEEDVIRFLNDYSEFERDVYLATFKIPRGKVSTYGRVAEAVGRPRANRAVANALHNNPLFPIVPCHRVVKADGGFGGESKAAAGRRRHVEDEGVPTRDGKVIMGEDVLF